MIKLTFLSTKINPNAFAAQQKPCLPEKKEDSISKTLELEKTVVLP